MRYVAGWLSNKCTKWNTTGESDNLEKARQFGKSYVYDRETKLWTYYKNDNWRIPTIDVD